jgi:glutaminyl-tRNA synthetase
MAVLEPLKVVITNWHADQTEWLKLENLPDDEVAGTRKVPFGREIYIEQEDFMEDPPKKFHRLAPGQEVRLKGAYIIKCEEVIKDSQTGKVTELRCTYDPDTRSGQDISGKKVKGVIHWVSAEHGLPATVRIYENLFTVENPDDVEEGMDFTSNINPNSVSVQSDCIVEPALADGDPESRYQFMRKGYFFRDPKDSSKEKLVFNRIVGLRDTWAKQNK